MAPDGSETLLELPDTWRAWDTAAGGGTGATWQPAEAEAGLELPITDQVQTVRVLVSEPIDPAPLPAVATPDVLVATGTRVGSDLSVSDELPPMRVVGTLAALPGTEDGTGVMVDLGWLSALQLVRDRPAPEVMEWWLTGPGDLAAAVEALGWTGAVLDRRAESRRLLADPLGSGVLVALSAAVVAAAGFAGFGLAVDARATAVRRRRELVVVHALGTGPPALARALMLEQAALAGMGVLAGVLVGIGVAVAMAPALVLTPSGAVPVPAPLLTLSPVEVTAAAVGLLALAVWSGAAMARRARRDVIAGILRTGEE